MGQTMSDVRNRDVLTSMRQMAWCRAKGELESIMCAKYYGDMPGEYREERKRTERFLELVKSFIETVEEEGLQE
jgi:hypothetical protein